ncbi:iron-containing alcohol dehydrogenase [Gaiella sp.]|uniref:iron-containing alcohol dehydrogenase n=1 Tax=Gaiella sp. TaxID=2663207 RepID=UPI002CB152FE|nr:iron-containing alcohol dehydrogenase [Gaiella sp.]HWO81531.1 iron-containing alcohol dehydrogenase [Gaiella sp.]
MTDERPARIVRFGAGSLAALADVCAEAGITRPLLVASRRGAASAGGLPVVGVYDGVRPHVPIDTVQEVAAVARERRADGLVAFGGGSAIDTCKAAVAELADSVEPLPRVVAIPTTYAGAEWTSGFGVLLEPGRKGGGRDERARPIAAIYDPELSLDLPLDATVGTAMNALAHCAEAYYHPACTETAARHADTGATAIGYALPIVAERPGGIYGRTRLLEGAFRAALALAESGLCLAHAMAQALGGRYGLPQGSMNAICLPVALRFNTEAVPDAVARFGKALGTDDPVARVEELARLGGFGRLRDVGVPEEELDVVAEAVVARPGAQANPRAASPAEVTDLLREVW